MMYYVNIFGIEFKGEDKRIILLMPVAVVAAYLASAVVLYAFVNLTGLLLFSWINAVYASILIYALHLTFNPSGMDKR